MQPKWCYPMNDLIRKVEAGIQKQTFAKLLNLKCEEAAEGRVVISCEKRDDLLQQTDLIHGGVTGALCEAAAGYAALTVLPEGQSVIGVEYKINLLRAITEDKAIAVAKVLKRSQRLMVVEVEAFNAGSNKIAAKMIFSGIPMEEG